MKENTVVNQELKKYFFLSNEYTVQHVKELLFYFLFFSATKVNISDFFFVNLKETSVARLYPLHMKEEISNYLRH